MLKLFYKKDGAVTIFLILILVPVLALTGIFVELSRVELSKPIIKSSADLALNTALTNYDAKLKDYYGLMGSVQESSNTLDVAQKYFEDCLNSKILYKDELEEMKDKIEDSVDDVSNILTGNGITNSEEKLSNLLQMELELPELSVSCVNNANLANPVILRSQIVEFMKYRAPVELVTGLFDGLRTQAETLKNLKKDRELQKKEQKAYEAENELLDRLHDIYQKVKEYNALGLDEKYLSDMQEDIGGTRIRDIYLSIHKNAVKRYINVEINDAIFQNFKPKIPNITIQTDTYSYTKDDVNKILEILTKNDSSLSYIKEFLEVQETIKGALSALNTGINYQNDIDRLQYTLQIYHKSGVANAITNYYNVVSRFWNEYKMVKKIYECVLADEDLENALKDYDIDSIYSYYLEYYNIESKVANADSIANLYDLLKYVYQYYKACEESYIRANASERANINSYMYVLNIMEQTVQDNNIYNEIEGTEDSKILGELWNKLNDYWSKMEQAKEILSDIQKMVEGGYIWQKSLYKLAKEYSSSLNEWNNSADYSTTDGSYCMDSKKRADDAISNKRDISDEQIDAFLKRITDIYAYCDDVSKFIFSDTKYGETAIFSINSVGSVSAGGLYKIGFAEAAKKLVFANDINGIVSISALESKAIETFQFIYGGQQITPAENNHPSFDKNPPDLYSYMKEMFKNEDAAKMDNGKKKYKEYKNSEDAKEDREITEEEDTANEITSLTAENFPSGFQGQSDSISIFDSLVTLASGLFSNFDATLKNARDELYVMEYCMNMFSYATYENEMKLTYMKEHDLKEEEIKKLSTSFASDGMINKWIKDISSADTQGVINKLKDSTDPNETANKTLTNKAINETNNYAYQREIEYILFGGKNASNIRNIKQELFKVRYALNIIPGYKLLWGNALIKSIAAGVSAATLGIVPEALVRVVMIAVLVGLESWNDMELLMEGVPVKFIKFGKDAEDAEWVWSVDFNTEKFAKDLADFALDSLESDDPITSEETDNTFRVSYKQYLTFFLYFQLTSGDTNKVNNVYKRIGDVIQANMSKQIYKIDDYKLSNCIVQYQFTYSAVVKPLMLNLGIYKEYNTTAVIDDKKWRRISGTIYRGY